MGVSPYPVSDTYRIRIRHGYTGDTYPIRIGVLGCIGPENLRLDMYLCVIRPSSPTPWRGWEMARGGWEAARGGGDDVAAPSARDRGEDGGGTASRRVPDELLPARARSAAARTRSAAGRAAGREREGGSSGAGRSSGEGGAGRRGRGRSERGSSRLHHQGGWERRQRDTVRERWGEMRLDREVCRY